MNRHIAIVVNEKEFAKDYDFNPHKIDEGITAIKGLLNNGTEDVTHAYEFDPQKFTVESAKKWLKKTGRTFAKFIEADVEEVNGKDIVAVIEDGMKAGARHSKNDNEIIRRVHRAAREIQSHMKELGYSRGMKAADFEEETDEMQEWSEGLTILGEQHA